MSAKLGAKRRVLEAVRDMNRKSGATVLQVARHADVGEAIVRRALREGVFEGALMLSADRYFPRTPAKTKAKKGPRVVAARRPRRKSKPRRKSRPRKGRKPCPCGAKHGLQMRRAASPRKSVRRKRTAVKPDKKVPRRVVTKAKRDTTRMRRNRSVARNARKNRTAKAKPRRRKSRSRSHGPVHNHADDTDTDEVKMEDSPDAFASGSGAVQADATD